ncbi:AraC family transcriptional regulator [Paenibacillus psychroresistens]|nr:AraC family transcriptional regulator [Paenibacillus psychroresistens]
MTYFPMYLKDYPNMHSMFPFHLSLNQIDNGYPAHRHDYLEFSYVISGYGSEAINGIHHPMRPGTFTFLLPYQIHELFTDPGESLVLYNCMFSMDLLMETGSKLEMEELLTDSDELSAFVQLGDEDHQRIKLLMEETILEYKANEPKKSSLLKAKLTEILIRFDRFRRLEQQISQIDTHERDTPPAKIRKNPRWPIIHHIQRSYQEPLMLADLSRIFALSMSRISECIKETTGQTFVQYLNDLRIRHACSLLISTEMSVSEIAYEVGYGSYKTFSKLFRDQKGIVPTIYRKQKMASEQ